MNKTVKVVLFWLIIGIAATLLWQVIRGARDEQRIPEISYSQFISEVDAGRVGSVEITRNRIRAQYKEGGVPFQVIGPSDAVYLEQLQAHGVEIRFRDASDQSLPSQLLATWAPLIFLALLWFFMMRQVRNRQASVITGQPPGISKMPQ